jgi:hypothetical protein
VLSLRGDPEISISNDEWHAWGCEPGLTVRTARHELGGEWEGHDGKSYSIGQRVTDDPDLLKSVIDQAEASAARPAGELRAFTPAGADFSRKPGNGLWRTRVFVLARKRLLRLAPDERVWDGVRRKRLPASFDNILHLLKMHHVARATTKNAERCHVGAPYQQAGALSVSQPSMPTGRASPVMLEQWTTSGRLLTQRRTNHENEITRREGQRRPAWNGNAHKALF